MKNKKLATLVALPLALSFSLGLSACSAPADPAKAPVSQEQSANQANDPATVKANATQTVESVRNILLVPETSKHILDFIDRPDIIEELDQLDPEDKIWNQVSPHLNFPVDDAGIVKALFGDSPEKGENATYAKAAILGMLTSEFAAIDLSTEVVPTPEEVKEYVFEYTSTKTLTNGNILPQNQVLVTKNESGAIIDAKVDFLTFEFSADGKKLSHDLDGEKKSAIRSSMESDAHTIARQIETELVRAEVEKKKPTQSSVEKYVRDSTQLSKGNTMSIKFNEKDLSYEITVENDDQIVILDSKEGLLREDASVPPNLLLIMSESVDLLDDDMVATLAKGEKIKDANDLFGKDAAKLVHASKISDDRKTLVATLDGIEFTFAIG